MISKNFLTAFVIMSILLFIAPNKSYANSAVGGPFFESGDAVRIDRKILGDTFVIGNDITVDKEIDGDLFAIGANIKINAPIKGDVRVVGSKVEISSHITGSVTFLINDRLYIPTTGEIDKDAYGIANHLIDEGRVGRNLELIGISEESTARIDGKVLGDYSNNLIDPGITKEGFVKGAVKKLNINLITKKKEKKSVAISKIVHSLSMILIGSLFLKINKKGLGDALAIYASQFRKNLLTGSLVILMLPVVTLSLFISIVGIPLSIILIFLAFSVLYVAPIFPSIYIGGKLLPTVQTKPTLLHLVIGAFLFDIITLAPAIGGVISITTSLSFLGLVFRYIRR